MPYLGGSRPGFALFGPGFGSFWAIFALLRRFWAYFGYSGPGFRPFLSYLGNLDLDLGHFRSILESYFGASGFGLFLSYFGDPGLDLCHFKLI